MSRDFIDFKNLTLCIIKPDLLAKKREGEVLSFIGQSGFTVLSMKPFLFDKLLINKFYHEHAERSFFSNLEKYMSEGDCIALAIYMDTENTESCAEKFRKLLGSTDPREAAPGTLRKHFGDSIDCNGTHGSDSDKAAKEELSFFFPTCELIRRSSNIVDSGREQKQEEE
jgi:nucleoside-diphosphate kinase